MQLLNTWTLRALFVAITLIAIAFVAVSGYGMLWYDHSHSLLILPIGIAIGIISCVNVYRNDIAAKPGMRQEWGVFYFMIAMCVFMIAALLYSWPPLVEFGYFLTWLCSLLFCWSMMEDWSDFWWFHSWRRLWQRVFLL